MGSKGKNKRCAATRAPRYVSQAAADEAILDSKIKSAINGSRAAEDRQAQICLDCGGWHIVTKSRRERRAET